MPRIIAGTLRGRTFAAPKGDSTRPTSDRVREALFSRLDAWGALSEATVLDLYAGSGGLGFEALSRGAASATFVEAHAATARLIRDNARSLDGITDRAEVRCEKAEAFARGPAPHRFSLVLCDPPYAVGNSSVSDVFAALLEGNHLEDGCVVLIERSSRSDPLRLPSGFATLGEKKYGETMLWWAEADLTDSVES